MRARFRTDDYYRILADPRDASRVPTWSRAETGFVSISRREARPRPSYMSRRLSRMPICSPSRRVGSVGQTRPVRSRFPASTIASNGPGSQPAIAERGER